MNLYVQSEHFNVYAEGQKTDKTFFMAGHELEINSEFFMIQNHFKKLYTIVNSIIYHLDCLLMYHLVPSNTAAVRNVISCCCFLAEC